MFNSLTTIMESNKKIWIGVKEIDKAYSSFLETTNKLNFLKEEYDKNLSSLIDKKKVTRKALIQHIMPITNIITAFARDFNKKGLVKKCDFTKSESKEIGDLDLQNYAKGIWKQAKKLYDKSIASTDVEKSKDNEKTINIHNYGLSEQMIDKLEITNIAFIEANLELYDAISQKEKCSKKLKSGIKVNNNLLKNKLDLLMSIYKISDNQFYKKYTSCRKIDANVKADDVKQKEKSVSAKTSKSAIKKEHEKNAVIEKTTNPAINEAKKANSLITGAKRFISKPVIKNTVSPKPAVKRPPRKRPSTVVKKIQIKKDSTDLTQ